LQPQPPPWAMLLRRTLSEDMFVGLLLAGAPGSADRYQLERRPYYDTQKRERPPPEDTTSSRFTGVERTRTPRREPRMAFPEYGWRQGDLSRKVHTLRGLSSTSLLTAVLSNTPLGIEAA